MGIMWVLDALLLLGRQAPAIMLYTCREEREGLSFMIHSAPKMNVHPSFSLVSTVKIYLAEIMDSPDHAADTMQKVSISYLRNIL